MAFEGRVDPWSTLRPGSEPALRAAEKEAWTCAIDSGVGTVGTGVLINQDLVLTNYHVIKDLLAKPADSAKASCRFDFTIDAETGEVRQGRRINFAVEWVVIWSCYSEKDEVGADTGFEPDRLDYAIIRLSESVGLQPGGLSPHGVEMPMRRWQTLPLDPYVPKPGSNITIWQHPVDRGNLAVMPQQCSSRTVLRLLDFDLRLRHDATTYPGSSGAGCFDVDYNFVALHHASDPAVDCDSIGRWNQAIPVSAIVRHLKTNGQAHLIGVTPPPPAAAHRHVVIERDQQLSDVVEKRIRAATMLMDRDAIEDRVCISRDKQDPNRGIVHVLACRHVDSHRNFMVRLAHLSLALDKAGIGKRRDRFAALLAGGPTEDATSWLRESLSWQPPDVSVDYALSVLKRDITAAIKLKRRVILEAEVEIGSVNLNRERKLLPKLAQLCASIASADRLQVFVIYYDRGATMGADRTATSRAEIGKFWSPERRPPGGGICANLLDINSTDLSSWCLSVQTGWQMMDLRMVEEVETTLGVERLPMLDAEKRLAPVLRRYVSGRP
ncbi:serine protease [Rhizobium ruizarguesonis]